MSNVRTRLKKGQLADETAINDLLLGIYLRLEEVERGGGVGPQGETGEAGAFGAAGGTGRIFYLDPANASDVVGMTTALDTPSSNAETTLSVAATGIGYNLLGTFISEPGSPGATSLPAGVAFRHFHCETGAVNQVASLKLELYTANSAGAGATLRRTAISPDFSNGISEIQWSNTDSSGYAMALTDRLIFKVYVARVGGPATCNITVYFNGTARNSYVQTTIATAGLALAAVGAAPNANAATLSGSTLNLEPASSTQPGVVTTAAQTWAGRKTFNNGATMADGLSLVLGTSGNTIANDGSNLIITGNNTTATCAGLDATAAVAVPGYNGSLKRGLYKITVPYTTLDDAGMGPNSAVLATLPAKLRFVSCIADVTTAFNTPAGATDVLMQVGYTGDLAALLASVSVTATKVVGDADAELGTNFVRAARIQGGLVPSWTVASNQLFVTLTLATGGSLAGLTQGSVTLYFIYDRMD
ncbi:MAG: hypothetical protein RL409_757 [Gemmatimonadota bacterium]